MKDDALYLEVDEDITSAIDKLTKSTSSSVQIVVPKRSTLLQSIINLKLLKKAADSHHKQLVLVTSDRIATELAGRIGLAVAPSLGAKATIAAAPRPADLKAAEEIIDADDTDDAIPAESPKPQPIKKKLLLTRRPLGDTPPSAAAADGTISAAGSLAAGPDGDSTDPAPSSAGRSASPKIPNFNRMQRRITWLSLGVLLVAGYMAFMYLGSNAKVTLYANGTKVDIDTTFTVDPASHSTDTAKAILAGQILTVSKDLTGPFTPTGKKDAGTKAAGTITVYNEYDLSPHTLVAGTRFQAPDGKIFRSKADATVPGATLSPVFPFTPTAGKSNPIPVEADAAGDTYNEAPAKYIIPGYSGTMQDKIYGQGVQMSGGTTKTITVVTQADVDAAKTDLIDKDKDNATRDLQGHLPAGYVSLPSSQATAIAKVSPNPDVDQEGDTASLTLKVAYTILAVKKTEYQALVQAQELKQIGRQNQIYNDGLDTAQVTAGDKDASSRQTFHLTTEAFGGTKIDTAALARQLHSQRYGDAVNIAQKQPGVSRAELALWPGWATTLPSRPSQISITIQVAGNK